MKKSFCLGNDTDVYLHEWSIAGDKAKLEYEDKTVLFVKKDDFDRAFGCIICLTKEEVQQNFAI